MRMQGWRSFLSIVDSFRCVSKQDKLQSWSKVVGKVAGISSLHT